MDAPDDAFLDGLWFAALQRDDDGLGSVHASLSPALLAGARSRREAVRRLEGGSKAREMRRVIEALRPGVPPTAHLPARALSLLAHDVDRETGRRWQGASAPPRRGFVTPPGLRAWLGRLGRWSVR